MANKRYDYSKVREMSDAKRKKAMKNKRGDSSSKSKSSVKAVKGKSSTESISTPAPRKAKPAKSYDYSKVRKASDAKQGETKRKSMKNIVGPGAVDKSSPTQIQRKASKPAPKTASNSTMTQIQKDKSNRRNTPVWDKGSHSQKYQDYIDSIKRASKAKNTPKKESSSWDDFTSSLGFKEGGMVKAKVKAKAKAKPRGWGKARHPKCK